MPPRVTLWPIQHAELDDLVRLMWDPAVAGEYQWSGFRLARARELERRWCEDGLIGGDSSFLAVHADDVVAGWVTWRSAGGSGNLEIGIALLPSHRGRGVGTEAQRLLVEYLFSTTDVHRLQADTEVGNVAEQRALQRVGFLREGVLRGAQFRDGHWRDRVIYGLLRNDPRPTGPWSPVLPAG